MAPAPAPSKSPVPVPAPAPAPKQQEQLQQGYEQQQQETLKLPSSQGTSSSKSTIKRPGLVHRFNALCLKEGLTGAVKNNTKRSKSSGFSSKQHADSLRQLVEDRLSIVGRDARLDELLQRKQHLPFRQVLSAVRRLCATLEAEHGLTPPRSTESPPPYLVRMRRYNDLLTRYGITEALEWGYTDSNRLRYKIYMALSEIDPYFDLNEHEFNALLCNTDYGLSAVLDEIQQILVLGKRAIPEQQWWAHYHDPAGCGSSANDGSPASPCTCAAVLGSSPST